MELVQNVDGVLFVNGTPLPISDDDYCFRPTPEFWDAWNTDKYAVKRAGLSVRKSPDGEWIGVYNPSAPHPELPEHELHQQWIASARQLVSDGMASPFFPPIPYGFDTSLFSDKHFPKCGSRCALVVSETVATSNGNFQLYLTCGGCGRKGVQLKGSVLGRELVVAAIAACLRADAEVACG
ncbi:MAG: hypothetical protein V6Z82_04370 [Flavobacteriales bacterium]